MTTNLIKTVLQNLPRYAEEEGDFYSVPRDALIDTLCQQHAIDRALAENTVALLESLLDTLAVLNTAYLQKGEWCFVSFPAQLMVSSVLMAMSDTDSRFFAANFWNTIDDLAKGETTDGKIAYIKALVDDFDNDCLALKTELLVLPDSFSSGYLFQPQKYGLTLLINVEKPLLAGVLGKEKPLDVVLTTRQAGVLLGLAAHCRGFEFATFAENITFHPYGWIDVKNNPALQAELILLAELFKDTDLIIENHQDVLFRLSIAGIIKFCCTSVEMPVYEH